MDKVRNNTMGQGVKAWVDQLSTSMLLAGVKAEIKDSFTLSLFLNNSSYTKISLILNRKIVVVKTNLYLKCFQEIFFYRVQRFSLFGPRKENL